MQSKDPTFIRRVFVAHYCNIPYHLLDKKTSDQIKGNAGVYPKTLVDELYAASYHLIRNFELAPYASDTKLEDLVTGLVNAGKL